MNRDDIPRYMAAWGELPDAIKLDMVNYLAEELAKAEHIIAFQENQLQNCMNAFQRRSHELPRQSIPAPSYPEV